MTTLDEIIVDNFAGGGGASTGIEWVERAGRMELDFESFRDCGEKE